MTAISPSELAAKAAHLGPPPGLDRVEATCSCAMCGRRIIEGELASRSPFLRSFTDLPSLADRSSSVVCWQCKAIWHRRFLQRYSKSVITETGFFKLASNVDQASFFLDPPAPPFIAILSNATQQHLIWRAPVNWSRDRYVVRFGPRLLVVRQPILRRAVAAQRRVLAAAAAKRLKHANTLFRGFERELQFSEICIDPRLDPLREDADLAADFASVAALVIGEIFALSIIGRSGLSEAQPLTRTLPAAPINA